jgi:hypothetical protein
MNYSPVIVSAWSDALIVPTMAHSVKIAITTWTQTIRNYTKNLQIIIHANIQDMYERHIVDYATYYCASAACDNVL